MALGDEITPSLPRGAANSPCYEYFGPEYNLDIKPLLMKDLNTPAYLQVRRPTEPDSRQSFAGTFFWPTKMVSCIYLFIIFFLCGKNVSINLPLKYLGLAELAEREGEGVS